MRERKESKETWAISEPKATVSRNQLHGDCCVGGAEAAHHVNAIVRMACDIKMIVVDIAEHINGKKEKEKKTKI
jgi:hypothetical protein